MLALVEQNMTMTPLTDILLELEEGMAFVARIESAPVCGFRVV